MANSSSSSGLGLAARARCCMVARLEEISGGEIAIAERVVNDVEPRRARHRDGVPELRVPAHVGLREHGLRPEDRKVRAPRSRARAWRNGGHPAARTLPQRKPRELSGGQRHAWRWAAPSRRNPCSCSTSRYRTSTPSCARRRGWRSNCMPSWASPRCSSRTTVEAMTLATQSPNAGQVEQSRHAGAGVRDAGHHPSSPASSARRR